MKLKNLHIIYIGALSFFACSEDHLTEEQPVEYCVRMDWSNGRGGGTRTLSSLLENVPGDPPRDLAILSKDYPEVINVKCNGKQFILSKPEELTPCPDHDGFYNGYISDYDIKDNEAKKGVTATATIDGGKDVLYSEAEDVKLEGLHLLFSMHHTKALLRFGFQVDPKYDQIRLIKVTKIVLNDKECSLEEKILKNGEFLYVAYLYVEPAFSVTRKNTIKCTYNIYDKDDATEEHLTREGVTATNSFTFSSLTDTSENTVTEIRAGYYYDLNVTLNPDYLYVLSEHDNKHITIQ